MRFHEIQTALTESQILAEAKVGREYQHLEDLVFVDGSQGAIKAADILDKLGTDSSDVSIKWDGCIHPDLLLQTDKGKLRIEEVIDRYNNDEEFTVLAKNLKTNENCYTLVLNAVKKHGPKAWVEVTLDNDEVLRMTEDHEVYTTNRGWVEAKDLTNDDDVETY